MSDLELRWPDFADVVTVGGVEVRAYADAAMVEIDVDPYEGDASVHLTPAELRRLGCMCYVLAKRLDDRT